MLNIYDPEFVRRLFNGMSDSYERMNYITSLGFSFIWRKQFLRSLPLTIEEPKILDLLSGMGENWKQIYNRFPNAQLTGLDFSEEMIAKSKKKNQKQLNDRVEILYQNLLENQLPSNHYDMVVSAFGLKTFNEKQLHILAGELYRVLKPGGSFSFIEISQPPNRLLLFFYRLYLAHIIPVLGKLFLGNPEDYKMLWKYTSQFKNAKRAQSIFQANGLEVHFESYFIGCASGLYGTK